jgi:ubiquinone biosynthesis protein UbiJ
MKNLFLNYLSKAINTYLKLDSESKERLKKLDGQVITIDILPLHFIFQCSFAEFDVTLLPDETSPSQAKICGTPLQMLGAMMTQENRHRFFADDLSITGNAELAQQVVNLFDELQIDWQEYLSCVIGDVPTHHVSRFINTMKGWLDNTEQTFSKNMNEYIHEEMNWLPSHEALQDLFTDIDTLRMDVDRLAARIKNLVKGADKTPNPEDKA